MSSSRGGGGSSSSGSRRARCQIPVKSLKETLLLFSSARALCRWLAGGLPIVTTMRRAGVGESGTRGYKLLPAYLWYRKTVRVRCFPIGVNF